MKVLKYQIESGSVNRGTEEVPYFEPILLPHERHSDEANFEKNYAIAQREAYNGEVTVEDIPDPEPVPGESEDVWAELDAAYQEGVNSIDE